MGRRKKQKLIRIGSATEISRRGESIYIPQPKLIELIAYLQQLAKEGGERGVIAMKVRRRGPNIFHFEVRELTELN
jgi:hypothetical protein